MTPEEFAEIANQQSDNSLDERITRFLLKASASQIEAFLHCLYQKRSRYFGFATIALDIRVLDDDMNAHHRISLSRRVFGSIGRFINPTFPVGFVVILVSFILGVTTDDSGPNGATSIWGWTCFTGVIVGLFTSCVGVALSAFKTARCLWSRAPNKSLQATATAPSVLTRP
jgi:hypothetical protein